MKKEYPDIIVGVDFSGSPTDGNFNDFKAILEKARSNGLRLALHCGEVENPLEINEMIQFGMDRLGHGTYIKGSYEVTEVKLMGPRIQGIILRILSKVLGTFVKLSSLLTLTVPKGIDIEDHYGLSISISTHT